MDTKIHFKTVDEYIKAFPKDVQEVLQMLRKTISDEIEHVEEAISYNMPTFKLNDDYVVYFAAWKKHISLYPYTSAMGATFKETADYETSGKGTIQFPIDKPLPLPLIRKIVRFRLKEVVGSKEKKY